MKKWEDKNCIASLKSKTLLISSLKKKQILLLKRKNIFSFEANYVSMKYLLLLGLLILSFLDSAAQHDPDKLIYLQKAEKYRKMKRTGMVLAVTGSALTVVGFVTLVNATLTETMNGGWSSTSPNTTRYRTFGAVSFLLGLGGMGSGFPLWAVGAHNQRKYKHRLDSLSLDFKVAPQSSGLALTYRF